MTNTPSPEKTKRRLSGSIRVRIVLVSTAFSAVLALLTAFFSYHYFTRSLRNTQRASVESNLQVVGAEVDLAFEKVTSFANWTRADTSISSYLEHMDKISGQSRSEEETRQDRILSFTVWELLNEEYNTTGRNDYIRRVIVMTEDGSHYLQCLQGTSQPSYIDLKEDVMEASWFSPLAAASGYLWQLEENPFAGEEDDRIIPAVREIERSTSSDVVGYVFLEISPDIFSDALSGIRLDEDAALYLTLDGGIVYEYRNRTLTVSTLPEGLVSYTLPRTGLTLSMQPSTALYRSQSRHYLLITIAVFAAVFFSGFALSLILRRLIADPVTALVSKAGRVGKGDFSRDTSIEWDNEFGDIGRGLNDLSENVSALMENKLKDERQKQALEYQILQSQINPHFLYNTLNTIKWMATIQGADGIAEMSTSLSRLLRNVSKGTKSLIPLRDELGLVQDYFTIMKYRYGGTIELDVQVDGDSLYDLYVNRFSLQPIVENAIFHGIEPKGSAGVITIHAYEDSGCTDPPLLHIDVTDNGIGMDGKTAEKVLHPDTQESTDFFRHVGISNVNQRIKYAFGKQYGIGVRSVPGEYTCMTMTIPACAKPPEEQ